MIPQAAINKFWASVIKGEPDECWFSEYKSHSVVFEDKFYAFSKILYLEKYGKEKYEKVEKGQVIKTCKNKFCCNPNHLIDNIEEYIKFLLDNPNNYEKVWNEELGSYCHLWTKTKLCKNGYVQIGFRSNSLELLHRWALILKGENMEGKVARHKCHKRHCVNPDHLLSGTHLDNAQDMVNANRQAKGEKSGTAKATETQVLEVIKLLRTTKLTWKEIAEKAKVSYKTVQHISSGASWTHLSNMPRNSKRADWYQNNNKQLSLF